MTKGYRRVRYKKGFGVHSPYAFSLITQVINENMHFYAYDEIRRLRKLSAEKRFSVRGFTIKKKISSKRLFLIYRLVNNYNPEYILQLGAEGIISYVLGLAKTESVVYSLCDDKVKVDKTKDFFEDYLEGNDRKYHLIYGKTEEGLSDIPGNIGFDFVYIRTDNDINCNEDIHRVVERVHNHSFIMIEGIKKEAKMKMIWDYLRLQHSVKISMDLYDYGLIIFHEKLYKKHYIVSY